MARLASEAKGGYYPTPLEEMESIMQLLDVPTGEKVSIIDPCAGEGHALHLMAERLAEKGATVTTYGIELEKSRALKAKTRLDHVLSCGYEEARMSHEAFSVMYLNPPFTQMQGRRTEEIFLQDVTNDYLPPGGLLIFNIPLYVLRFLHKTLASRFIDIRVYRFSDRNGNYDRFQQVIIFARRRKKGLRTKAEIQYKERIEAELYNLSFLGKDAVTPLDRVKSNDVYLVKSTPKLVSLFQSMKVDPEDIVSSQTSCGHLEKTQLKMNSLLVDTSLRNISPAMPLKYTHIAAAISAGALPETMGSHMLVGVTKRIQEERSALNPKTGKEQNITTFKPKSIVRIFSDKGIYNLK